MHACTRPAGLVSSSSISQYPDVPCSLQGAHYCALRLHTTAQYRRNVQTRFRTADPADADGNTDACKGFQQGSEAAQPLPPLDPASRSQKQNAVYKQTVPNPYPLKNAQLGHSRFSRGSPHICYGQFGDSGIFYIKPEMDQRIDDWQQWLTGQWHQWHEQQHQWLAQPQEQLHNKQVQMSEWIYTTKHLLGLNPSQPGSRESGKPGGAMASPVFQDSSASSNMGTDGIHDDSKSRGNLLDSIHSNSAAAGAVGIAATLAAALIALLSKRNGLLRGFTVSRLLLGVIVGVTALVVFLQSSRVLVAVLLLCYAGISVL